MNALKKYSEELMCPICDVSNWTQIESLEQNKQRWKCKQCGVYTFECEK